MESYPEDFESSFEKNRHHFDNLQKIAATTFHEWRGIGSYLMNGADLSYEPVMLEKQRLFFEAAKHKTHLLEIGVHAGHSLLIALMANAELKVDCIDICYWAHTEQCVNYLNAQFADRITLYKGDSAAVLPTVVQGKTFDMVHVDGHHDIQYVQWEYDVIKDHIDRQSALIFDDIDTPGLHQYLSDTFGSENITVPNCKWANALINTC